MVKLEKDVKENLQKIADVNTVIAEELYYIRRMLEEFLNESVEEEQQDE